jgi:N-acetylglucosaminyl-diphospho-decaprenol L-rhamnosyltransferase
MIDATDKLRAQPKPTGPQLTAVIVTYKSSSTIAAALAAARRCVEAGLLKVIVVDNASPDDTREVLAREAGFAHVVLNDANIGFGRGCNTGLALVTTPYVIFYNPDADMEPGAASAIVEFMENYPKCALAGPAIGRDDGKGFQHVGGLLRPWDIVADCLGLYRSLKRRQNVEPQHSPFQTDWVSGAMLVGRSTVLQQMGGFDPRYFLYWEETDLCRRVLDAGYEIWATPQAVVHHIGGVSAQQESSDRVRGCIPVHFYQSRQWYLRKHHGGLVARAAELAEFVLMPLHEGLRALMGRHHQPVFARWKHPLWSVPRRVETVGGGSTGVLPPFRVGEAS